MINGCMAAAVTPFSDDGSLDIAAFSKYISFLANSRLSGIVVCGSTGESLSLSFDEKMTLFRAARKAMGDNGPKLYAGVIEAATQNGVKLIKASEDIVDGFLCICPFYVRPSAAQIYEHFKALAESTARNIILYNNPGRVATSIELATLKKLSTIKNIVAIKECGADLSVFATWRAAVRDDFAFLTGNDDTYAAAISMGACGVISVTANVVPDLCSAIFSSYQQGNLERFAIVRDALQPLHKLLFAEPSPGPVKYVLSKLGFMRNKLRMPLAPIGSALRTKLDKVMRDLNLEPMVEAVSSCDEAAA